MVARIKTIWRLPKHLYLRRAGRPLVTNCMLMQKEMTYLWAEMARNRSHTDLQLSAVLFQWFDYLVLSVRPMAMPSNTACREIASTTRKPRRAAWVIKQDDGL